MISNEIGTGLINLVDHETLKRIVHDVLKDVSSVKSTLGPGGKANLIHDAENTSLYQSKDGYRIVMDMHYDDYFYDSIAKLIKDASAHNNAIIGDGTTSAIVVLAAFYNKLEELVEKHAGGFEHISLTGVSNILDALKTVLKDELIDNKYVYFLKDYTKDEQFNIITKVATIAANNDKTIGLYVAKLFEKIIKDGKFDDLYVDIVPNYSKDTSEKSEIGFRMQHSYINRIYATEPDGSTATYADPQYLLIEGALLDNDIEKIEPIIDYVCFMKQKPLVIIAADYTSKMSQYLYSLRLGGQRRTFLDPNTNKQVNTVLPPYQIIPIMLSAGDDEAHEKYEDLEIALGGRAIPAITQTWESLGTSPNEWESILGKSDKITCVPFETSITGGYGNSSKIDARIQKLQNELDHMVLISDGGASELRKAKYQERISMLKSNMVEIRVGGNTFKERQYNCLVYEDAVYAVKSTIKNGFTLAGQVSMKHLVKNHADSIIDKVIKKLETEGRNVTFGAQRKPALKNAIQAILDVLYDTITTAYEIAISNAIFDQKEIEEIKNTMYDLKLDKPMSYNLMNATYESIDLAENCNMLVPGNTDYETFSAIVGITNIFLNTDNLETLYIPRRLRKDEVDLTKKNN